MSIDLNQECQAVSASKVSESDWLQFLGGDVVNDHVFATINSVAKQSSSMRSIALSQLLDALADDIERFKGDQTFEIKTKLPGIRRVQFLLANKSPILSHRISVCSFLDPRSEIEGSARHPKISQEEIIQALISNAEQKNSSELRLLAIKTLARYRRSPRCPSIQNHIDALASDICRDQLADDKLKKAAIRATSPIWLKNNIEIVILCPNLFAAVVNRLSDAKINTLTSRYSVIHPGVLEKVIKRFIKDSRRFLRMKRKIRSSRDQLDFELLWPIIKDETFNSDLRCLAAKGIHAGPSTKRKNRRRLYKLLNNMDQPSDFMRSVVANFNQSLYSDQKCLLKLIRKAVRKCQDEEWLNFFDDLLQRLNLSHKNLAWQLKLIRRACKSGSLSHKISKKLQGKSP